MTAPIRDLPQVLHEASSAQSGMAPVNRVELQQVARDRAAALIRAAFPAESDRACAKAAATWLQVSDRAVLNWLAGDHAVPFEIIFALGCRVGVFVVMEVMTMGQSRSTWLGRIVQGVRRVGR